MIGAKFPSFPPGVLPIVPAPRFVRALNATLSGLADALRTERAFQLEAALLAASLPVSVLLTPDHFRRAELVGCLLAVLAIELLNTGVEKLCDRITTDFDPVIKSVKDMGSAAGFCALGMAGLLWIVTAFERFA